MFGLDLDRNRKAGARRPRRRPAARLYLEPLEDWTVPSGLPGSLDPTFGEVGRVITDFSGQGSDMTIQPDGKIIVVGSSTPFASITSDFAVARFHPDGSLDHGFGIGGRVTTDFAGSSDAAFAVVVQADGKIVVAGRSIQAGTGNDFALVRYNPDGSLDQNFGTNGRVTTDFGEVSDFEGARGVVIQPDGKIIAVGAGDLTPGATTTLRFALARYNSDGSPDDTFGVGGKASALFGLGQDSRAESVALQPDGKIVVVGLSNQGVPTGQDFAVARFTSAGVLDATFGTGGLVATHFAGNDQATGVAVTEDGKIIVSGSGGGFAGFALARYTSGGVLDDTFGIGGKVITPFAQASFFSSLALQADGKIVVAGRSNQPGTGFDFALARYTPAGVLDVSFGDGGRVTTDFAGGFDQIGGIGIDPQGRIVVAGSATASDGLTRFAVARYFGEKVPVVKSVAAGSDLRSFVIQLNDDDLNLASATNPANYRVIAARGDANGDGNPFNDGDEVVRAISSVAYDPATDRVTLRLVDAVFADFFRVELDGDDATTDGMPGLVSLSGRFLLSGADFAAVVDLRPLTLLEDLLAKVEQLGLATGTENSLTARLEAAARILGAEVESGAGVIRLLEAFKIGVDGWFSRGEITQEDRNDLIADADLILLGLALTG